MDVEHHGPAAIFSREIIAIVDAKPTMGMAPASFITHSIATMGIRSNEMLVVGNCFDVGVNIRIEVPKRIGLAQIIRALNDVPEVRNDAGLGKPFSLRIVVESPGVGGAMGENVEFLLQRMISPVGTIELRPLVCRRSRSADNGMGEDAVAAVEPAVRSPVKRIQRFMRVLIAPAIE